MALVFSEHWRISACSRLKKLRRSGQPLRKADSDMLMLFLRDAGSNALSCFNRPPQFVSCCLEAAEAAAAASEATPGGLKFTDVLGGTFERRNHSTRRGSSLIAQPSGPSPAASSTAGTDTYGSTYCNVSTTARKATRAQVPMLGARASEGLPSPS